MDGRKEDWRTIEGSEVGTVMLDLYFSGWLYRG